jgi:hypothetical protein
MRRPKAVVAPQPARGCPLVPFRVPAVVAAAAVQVSFQVTLL